MPKLTDREAIEQVKQILKDCSPQAKKAIAAMFTPTHIPQARSMQRDDLKIIPEIQRLPPQVYDKTKETPMPLDEGGDEWLNDWIKPK